VGGEEVGQTECWQMQIAVVWISRQQVEERLGVIFINAGFIRLSLAVELCGVLYGHLYVVGYTVSYVSMGLSRSKF